MRTQLIFLTVLAALLSISTSAKAVEFGPNSANITNRYFPSAIGRWSYMLGVDDSFGSAIYDNAVGIEEVNGARIGAQTFNNVKCLKWNHMRTNNLNDEDEFVTLWIAQDTQGNVWILKAYMFFEDTTVMLGTDFKSMFMPAVPEVGDPASIIMPETATTYCRVVEADISIDTNFGKYNSCIKTHCFYESSIESGDYFCPNAGMVRVFSFDDGNPQDVMDLKEYGTVTDTKAEIIGTWSSGIWYYDVAASNWTKMTSSIPDGDIAAGDFTGDGKADVASCWKNGLWYQNGASLAWAKLGTAPNSLTAGDIAGVGRSVIIGTWSSGIWYYDVATSKWTQMTTSTPVGDVAAGDFTGDGKADVASCWNNGLWYQDGATLIWTKVSGTAPDSMTAGDITGDGRSEIIGTWTSGIWYWDFVASKWTQMNASSPTGDIAAGDFTGDGKADVASCWSNGLWYQDGATLDWTKVTGSAPFRLTAGDVTGN